jgi:hypothetical protein
MSDASLYKWKSRYGGLDVSQLRHDGSGVLVQLTKADVWRTGAHGLSNPTVDHGGPICFLPVHGLRPVPSRALCGAFPGTKAVTDSCAQNRRANIETIAGVPDILATSLSGRCALFGCDLVKLG